MLNFWSFTSPLGAHRRPQFKRSTINNRSDYAIAIKQHVAVSISPIGVRLIINLLHANKCKQFWTLQRVASDVNWTRANPTPAHDCHVRLGEWNHSRHFERGSYWNVKCSSSKTWRFWRVSSPEKSSARQLPAYQKLRENHLRSSYRGTTITWQLVCLVFVDLSWHFVVAFKLACKSPKKMSKHSTTQSWLVRKNYLKKSHTKKYSNCKQSSSTQAIKLKRN